MVYLLSVSLHLQFRFRNFANADRNRGADLGMGSCHAQLLGDLHKQELPW